MANGKSQIGNLKPQIAIPNSEFRNPKSQIRNPLFSVPLCLCGKCLLRVPLRVELLCYFAIFLYSAIASTTENGATITIISNRQKA